MKCNHPSSKYNNSCSSNSYIPPWGVVVLHIGVRLHSTPMCKTTSKGGIQLLYNLLLRQHHCTREIWAHSQMLRCCLGNGLCTEIERTAFNSKYKSVKPSEHWNVTSLHIIITVYNYVVTIVQLLSVVKFVRFIISQCYYSLWYFLISQYKYSSSHCPQTNQTKSGDNAID